ncbi:colicin I receptor precursor [bacterium BMS3Bbin03]|nr:colicin I receptor precursor [bacterium BMS3Bbin03]HDZ12119.1 TonB-dependent receptor [Bacteroidota bacterium]
MKRLQFLIIVLGFVFSPIGLFAQQGQISGKVTNAVSHRGLAGANVVLAGTKFGTMADTAGHYEITHIPPGRYEVAVTYIGYTVAKRHVIIGNSPVVLNFQLQPRVLPGQEVVITATRAVNRETPVTFTNITRKELSKTYWAQDIPMLLTEVPGVYAYSDAGNGLGYAYVKIRGFDQKRVSVMINGIPLNDPEDHQVYWVDMPGLAASVQDIQIQRGVGSSLYGSSSFGGSINLVTGEPSTDSRIRVISGMGSYNTRKFSINLNSGLVNNTYLIQGRFSKVLSDGYRENTGINLWAYFLSAMRYGLNTTTKINVYGGPELTHAGWYASPESELVKNHRYNPIQYKNTIDNFNQPHYELIHTWRLSDNLSLNNTLFYIHGIGYYEGFKSHKKLVNFGFQPFYTPDSSLVKRTDLVRQKWVKKDQIGWIPRLDWKHKKGTLSLGLNTYTYWSTHWGNVIWAAQLPPNAGPNHEYYRYKTKKNLGTFFVHELYHITPALSAMGEFNLQLQKYNFFQEQVANFKGEKRNSFQVTYTFWNPRFGLNYNLSKRLNFYGNVSVAHREPSDDDLFDVWQGPDDIGVHPLFAKSDTVRKANGVVDYVDWRNPLTKPEALLDFELGTGYKSDRFRVHADVYWMNFRNEIVPYSQVDKDGFPIKGNAEKTIHRGIETSVSVRILRGLQASGALSVSQNYFAKFKEYKAIYDADWNFIGAKTIDLSGNTIAGFPNLLANGKLSYNGKRLSGYMQVQYVGKQYLDNSMREDRTIHPFTLVNLHASYDLKNVMGLTGLRFNVWINNVFNKIYETAGYYDSWEGENYFWPGAGRNYFVGIETAL